MRKNKALVQLILFFLFGSICWGQNEVRVRTRNANPSQSRKTSPNSLFFEPDKNEVKLENQRIDFDLSKLTELRLGPYILDESQVSMQMTREKGEYTEVDFGLESRKRFGPVYVLSFKWPVDYIKQGEIEIINDKAESLWRRKLVKQDLVNWQLILSGSKIEESSEEQRNAYDKAMEDANITKSEDLSKIHQRTQWGLAHRGFFEIPISQIQEAFRFCLSEDKVGSRLALCSRRYQFKRVGGAYVLEKVSKEVVPAVYVNDKPVDLKGSAIFLDDSIPVKLSALLKSGAYFEFVSHPKAIRLIDIVENKETKKVEIIGYGDSPITEVKESFFVDQVNLGLLNFMPTIGDLRKLWRTEFNSDAHYIYLKGQGGAPFRQNFDYESLPTTRARVELNENTTKSTYKSKFWVAGKVNPEIKLDATDALTERISPTDFKWEFPAPEPGVFNKAYLNVYENEKKYKAGYEIYRGFPAELAFRFTGVLTSNLTLILMAELGGQYWFEDIFGWKNDRFSTQRWGISSKYFEAIKGTKHSLKTLAAGNVDLKYRLTPGVWGRDPTVGLIASGLNLDYGFEDDYGSVAFAVPAFGGGVFWARSMPRIFDDLFNLVPFMRYPKWVDWEVVFYPLTIKEKQKSNYMFTMNFHGKVQWTQYFYGEAGFGIKNLSFSDHHYGDPYKQLDPKLAILYSQVGLGFNF